MSRKRPVGIVCRLEVWVLVSCPEETAGALAVSLFHCVLLTHPRLAPVALLLAVLLGRGPLTRHKGLV